MQLGEEARAAGNRVRPAEFADAGRRPSASSAKIHAMLAIFLAREGYLVEQFDTAESAVVEPDLVLLDLELPDRID